MTQPLPAADGDDPAATTLRNLYEDAVLSPGFTFRGPALPLIVQSIEHALSRRASPDRPDDDLTTRLRHLLTFAVTTGHVPTDELADVLGSVLVEDFVGD